MHLKALRAENVKKLKSVDLRFDTAKPLVIIRGKNKAAKSTLIDLPRYLFGGAKTHPPRVIREGEREAIIEGETEDFIAIRRWWKDKDDNEVTELELRATDGSPLKKAQSILDKIFDDLAFDPLEFARLKGPEQVEHLKKLTGVDTTPLERAREKLFEDRKLVNRDLSNAEGHLKLLPTTPPPAKVDVQALLAEQQKWIAAQNACAAAKRARDDAQQAVLKAQQEVAVAQRAVDDALNRHKRAMAAVGPADNALDDATEAAEGSPARLEAIRGEISAGQESAAAHAKWEERQRVSEQVKALKTKTEAQTEEIQKLDAQKAALVAAAKFPVDGLGFGADGVTLNGLPFEQASQAEQVRVCVAIVMARNPKLRLMGVREGSFLDDDSLKLIEDLCTEHDMGCLLEMVGENGPASLVLVDGAVRR